MTERKTYVISVIKEENYCYKTSSLSDWITVQGMFFILNLIWFFNLYIYVDFML